MSMTKKHQMDFAAWCRMVDDAVEAYAGLGKDDLPDCPYRDWYDDGMAP